MARFGHYLIAAIIWIAIGFGVGFLGMWMTRFAGLWAILGWAVGIAGFLFAVLSIMQIIRVTALQVKGIRRP